MEVLRVYYSRALASVYKDGLYAEMYSITLAAVSTCDYAFGLKYLLHFTWKLNRRQMSSNNWRLIGKTEGI